MVGREFRVSDESRPILEPYAGLPLSDERRHELFSFLADAVEGPNSVGFEYYEELRWTWLEHVAVVWRVNLVLAEIDVVDVWDL